MNKQNKNEYTKDKIISVLHDVYENETYCEFICIDKDPFQYILSCLLNYKYIPDDIGCMFDNTDNRLIMKSFRFGSMRVALCPDYFITAAIKDVVISFTDIMYNNSIAAVAMKMFEKLNVPMSQVNKSVYDSFEAVHFAFPDELYKIPDGPDTFKKFDKCGNYSQSFRYSKYGLPIFRASDDWVKFDNNWPIDNCFLLVDVPEDASERDVVYDWCPVTFPVRCRCVLPRECVEEYLLYGLIKESDIKYILIPSSVYPMRNIRDFCDNILLLFNEETNENVPKNTSKKIINYLIGLFVRMAQYKVSHGRLVTNNVEACDYVHYGYNVSRTVLNEWDITKEDEKELKINEELYMKKHLFYLIANVNEIKNNGFYKHINHMVKALGTLQTFKMAYNICTFNNDDDSEENKKKPKICYVATDAVIIENAPGDVSKMRHITFEKDRFYHDKDTFKEDDSVPYDVLYDNMIKRVGDGENKIEIQSRFMKNQLQVEKREWKDMNVYLNEETKDRDMIMFNNYNGDMKDDMTQRIQLQKKQFLTICDMDSLLITGPPGSGKSEFIRLLSEKYGKDRCLRLAHSNCAANNINGETLYKFARVSMVGEKKINNNFKSLSDENSKYKVIIVDEISQLDDICLLILQRMYSACSKRVNPIRWYLFGDFDQIGSIEGIDIEGSCILHQICNSDRLKLLHNWRMDEVMYHVFISHDYSSIHPPILYNNTVRHKNSICFRHSVRCLENIRQMYTDSNYIGERCKISQTKWLKYLSERDNKPWVLGANAPMICTKQFTHANRQGESRVFIKGHIYTIDSVSNSDQSVCIKNNGLVCILLYNVNLIDYFDPAFCVNVDKIQGITLNGKYTIYEWSRMSKERRYVSFSRMRSIDNVNFSDIYDRTDSLQVVYEYSIRDKDTKEVIFTYKTTLKEPIHAYHRILSHDIKPKDRELYKDLIAYIDELRKQFIDPTEKLIFEYREGVGVMRDNCSEMVWDGVGKRYRSSDD